MITWKEKLLSMFVPDLKPVVIAFDEDSLLSEESIVTALKNRDFLVVLPNRLAEVRYEYEKYIDNMVRGVKCGTLLIIHQHESDFSIPYDIVKNAQKINVSFDSIFPHLSSIVLHSLSSEQYSDVFDAYEDEKPSSQLGYDRTCLFLLKNLFRIHPQELKTDNDLVSMLLKTHFEGTKIPTIIGDYFSQYMDKKGKYKNWLGLSELLVDSTCFWTYLQDAWDNTITNEIKPTKGPSTIDFTKNNIAVYIDDAFEKGYMHITRIDSDIERPNLIPENLFNLSKRHDSKEQLDRERVNKLYRQLISEMPSSDSSLTEWITYQEAYSEYMYLNVQSDNTEMFNKINSVFVEWIHEHYDALGFETGRTPILLPKVVDYLKREKAKGSKKIALVVLDGMSYSQWLAAKSELSDNNDLCFEDNTAFACIPTLTSVSRQSIFSGIYPRFFSSSILKTSEEPKLWEKAWKDVCIPTYLKNDGTGRAEVVLEQIVPSTQVVGIVINTIDDLMHSTILGNKEFYERIRLWMKDGFLKHLLEGLIDLDFSVWLTSDHGNIESIGTGTIKTGQLAETKGARAFIMPSKTLRDQFVSENGHASCWDSKMLPADNFSVLTANGSGSFIKIGTKEIVHGGISIDEVMVPFVHIHRKEQ